MRTCVGTYACLIALASLGTARGDDTAQELAQIAGEWVAESSVRTGQEPAKKAVLKGLTLEVSGNRWVQNYRGELAPYVISLDTSRNPKAMVLTHQKVNAQRICTYELEGDRLTITEQIGQAGDERVTVWRRKPPPG